MLKRKESHFRKVRAVAEWLTLCSMSIVFVLVVLLKESYSQLLFIGYLVCMAVVVIACCNDKCTNALLTMLSVVLFIGKIILCLPVVMIISAFKGILQGINNYLRCEIRYYLSIHRAK